VLAGLTASPVAFSGGNLDRFEQWWERSPVPDRQIQLGRALRILGRGITVATVYLALPVCLVLAVVSVSLQSETLALIAGYLIAATVLIGIPVSLMEAIFFAVAKKLSGPSSPGPLTFKMAVEQAQESPWLPVVALGLLVTGAVLQLLATSF